MTQVVTGNGIKRSEVSNGNGIKDVESMPEEKEKVWGIVMDTPKPKSPVTQTPKTYQDTLAYEDKWIGWDGPVWCSRYGRFENKEDAAVDDGYIIKGAPPHQDLGLERCEKHGCDCRVPFQHRSYVQDIQRRVEPMVASLVKLEQRVGTLLHHASLKINEDLAPGDPSSLKTDADSTPATNTHLYDHAEHGVADRDSDIPNTKLYHASETDLTEHSTEAMSKSLRRLEARVEHLMHQMHQLMNHHGHHIPDKELQ